MYFLSLETSTKTFSLALSQDDRVLRFRNLKSTLLLEDSIIPAIDKMLGDAGITFESLDGLAIALGPGSFTSLRVGLATVKALAFGSGKPVVGIPSLDILARGVQDKNKDADQICIINDARRGMVYAGLYDRQGRISDYMLTSLDKVLDMVHGQTIFAGDALINDRNKIEEAYRQHGSKSCACFFADQKFWYPQAKIMAGIAYARFLKKEHDDPSTLVPLYLYEQDCQVSLK